MIIQNSMKSIYAIVIYMKWSEICADITENDSTIKFLFKFPQKIFSRLYDVKKCDDMMK